MLTIQEFIEKISQDFHKIFTEVKVEGKFIRLGNGVAHVELPVCSIYKEYQVTDYDSIKELHVKIASEILNRHKFCVDYSNVYPILKGHDFGINSTVEFYKKNAFVDLEVLYVADMGETFRFFIEDDDVDFNLLEQKAMENINRMVAGFVPLDKGLQVYTLKYTTDYASSLLLSKSMNKQIKKKIGDDILIAIPSNSSIFIAKFNCHNQELLKYLIKTDLDSNKVSDAVYRRKGEIYMKMC